MQKATEFGGFVFNRERKEFELIFVTQMSALLARNRAKEQAEFQNRNKAVFDPQRVIVKQRKVYAYSGPWMSLDGKPAGGRGK